MPASVLRTGSGSVRLVRLVGDPEVMPWVARALGRAGIVAEAVSQAAPDAAQGFGRGPVLAVARPSGVTRPSRDLYRSIPCLVVVAPGATPPDLATIPVSPESIDVVREPEDEPLVPQRVVRLLALHSRRLQTETLLGNLTDIVYSRTLDGRLTSVNAAAERFFGRRGDELIGRSIVDLFLTPDSREIAIDIARTNLELEGSGHHRTRFDYPLLGSGRRIFDGELHLLRDIDGSASGVQVVLTDVTEETHARELLERQSAGNEALASVAAAARDTLHVDPLLVSATGILGRLVAAHTTEVWLLDASRTLCRVAAHWRASEEVPSLVGFERKLEESPAFKAMVETLDPYLVPDASAIPLGSVAADVFRKLGAGSCCGVPIRYEGDVIGVLGVTWAAPRALPDAEIVFLRRMADQIALGVRTARLHGDLQRQLDALAEAHARREAADRDHQRLTAMLVHDLKNPLSAIGAALELTRERVATALPGDRIARMLDASLASARNLEGLIEDALLVYRGDDAPAPSTAACDPGVLLARPVEEARWLAEARRVSLDVEVPAGLPSIVVDAPRYQRAVSNLIANALKFTPRDGRVVVRASLDVSEGERVFRLSVADSGPGVPAEERRRLANPWVRLSVSAAIPGTGLGLAVVRKVAESHGGRLEISTNDGPGSVFSLVIPA